MEKKKLLQRLMNETGTISLHSLGEWKWQGLRKFTEEHHWTATVYSDFSSGGR